MNAKILLASAALALPAWGAQQAPITLSQPAPFVQLDSRPEAWRLSQGTAAADWRLLDAQGQRIPFAQIPDETQAAAPPQWRELKLFTLPPAPARKPVREPAGTLIDLGEPELARGQAERLRLHWPDDVPPFQAGYRLQTSADLQHWQFLSTGQLLSLAGPDGSRLQQRELTLHATPQRYLRLLWDHPTQAVRPQGASLLERGRASTLPPLLASETKALAAADAEGALLLDLGGPQRLRSFQLRSSQGTWVLPMQLQMRASAKAPWTPLAHPVLYRVEREGGADEAPALELDVSAVQLRLLPPKGAALPAAGSLRAEWQVLLPRFVWAVQGQAPYRLEVASSAPDAGPAPLHQVVPNFATERARLGRAEIGAFSAVPVTPPPGPSPAQRQALLWAVLGLGVAGLGWAAWRLLRQGHADSPGNEGPGN